MASLLYHSRSGCYFAQFYDNHRNPTRKTVSLKTKKKRVAERALARLEDAAALGEYDPWTPDKKQNDSLGVVGPAVAAYLGSCSHLKPSTIKTYRDVLIPFQNHIGFKYPVSGISVNNILSWLDSTSAGDVTRRKYVNHLGYFFRYLIKRGELNEDLSKMVPLRKVPEMAPKAMSIEEVQKLVSTIRSYSETCDESGLRRDFTWFALLVEANVYLGLRRGELLNLQWDHINMDRRILVVKNSEEFTTKSSRERSIPICDQCADALNQLKQISFGKYVFQYNGARPKLGTLTKIFQKFRCMASLPEHINLHSTRHTFGTWLAERGVPVTVIQSLMGHSSVTTTERYMSTRADVAEHWVKRAFDS